MAASPSTGLYRRLRILRPHLDVIFQFSVDAMSVQRLQDGSDWKGAWEKRWAVVWTEYRRRRDQVRRYSHRCRIYVDIPFRSLVQSFPYMHRSASRSLSQPDCTDGRIFGITSTTRPPRPRKL